MKKWVKSFLCNTDGGTMAVFAVAVPLMLGAVAVSVETGYWMKSKSDTQMVADMAAYAGGKELEKNTSAAAINIAKLHALRNNYDFDSGTIEVNSPPLNGAYAGQDAVEVILVQQGLKFFSGIVSDDSIQYRVRAVAAVLKDAELCALSLNTNANNAFLTRGNTSIDFDGCSVGTNSTHNGAVDIGNNSTLIADCIYSAGGIDGGDNATTSCSENQSDAAQITDPFGDVVAPTETSHPDATWDDPCLTPTSGPGSSRSMVPGRYCDDITINRVYNLAPGTYIFDDMDLSFQGGTGTLNGTGVTLILINDSRLQNINGNDQINIEAQTSGTYAGLAIFSDPLTQPDNVTTRFNGSSGTSIGGAIYYPNQDVEFSGNTASVSDCTLIIADTIEMTGGSTMSSNGCEANFGITAPNQKGTFIVE